MLSNATPARVVRWVLVCLYLAAGSFVAAAQTRSIETGAAGGASAATSEPLRFFTLRERIQTLRASGRLPGGEALDDRLPPAHSIGLRLSFAGSEPDVFLGALPFAVPGGDLAAKWRGALVRWSRDEEVIAGCATGTCRDAAARTWLRIRAAARKRNGREVLGFVHQAFNQSIRYASDFQAFGVSDYWASPLEVVGKSGDCEDYVLAKFFMLRSIGLDGSEMKIVALRELATGEYHAVLAVRSEGEWVFLDNKQKALTSEQDYGDTLPIATIDESGQSMLVRVEKSQFALRLAPL